MYKVDDVKKDKLKFA